MEVYKVHASSLPAHRVHTALNLLQWFARLSLYINIGKQSIKEISVLIGIRRLYREIKNRKRRSHEILHLW